MSEQSASQRTIVDQNPTQEVGTETEQASSSPSRSEGEISASDVDTIDTDIVRAASPSVSSLEASIAAIETSTAEYSRKKRETRNIINMARRISAEIGGDQRIRTVALCSIVIQQARELRACLRPGQAAIDGLSQNLEAIERMRRQVDPESSESNNREFESLNERADTIAFRLVAALAELDRQKNDLFRFVIDLNRLLEYAYSVVAMETAQVEDNADADDA
jgi:hypothetical protein